MKNRVLSNLKPQSVFRYFEDICEIPHGTNNTSVLEEYCLNFAKEHGLESYHDAFGNVMIFKAASPGYEDHQTVILQGHLDMVCEKVPECKLDLAKEAIILKTDGSKIWADGTTLGADDGIGLAYVLSILDDDTLKHPALEAIFTTDEEEGLTGAHNLDASRLSGTCMINIDSEEEGILTVSCAGASRLRTEFEFQPADVKECSFVEVTVGGLLSGHSGSDINLGRKNAGLLIGELLSTLLDDVEIGVAFIECGGRPNVISANGKMVIYCKNADLGLVMQKIRSYEALIRKDCELREPDVRIKGKVIENISAQLEESCLSLADTRKIECLLTQVPYGVYAMNAEYADLVESSNNVGHISYSQGHLEISHMVRSNTEYGLSMLKRKIKVLTEFVGGNYILESEYMPWEYIANSNLRDVMVATYEEMYREKPIVASCHAGLECGIIGEKMPGLDMVSFGPDMKNVHTPDEELDIASTWRSYEYLINILERL